ncbi:magnesium-transporting ATPase (P-type) [Paenibacillus sp. JGP012]|uniref:YtpI family protein n=1 Tax=Paenibacillus TaxID=44249 RepID=UPI00161B86D1|nr:MULTISPECIES: YtpI family protein [Paenibacillus]MBB6019022.1 magnesium-transporting ATPase (P-type) [Paenibacillus sp. JGP012]MBU5356191.1 YtpI family protein [Paenibacillus barcinonensis]MDM5278752.1 YtpI family protein [Paenibacillus silvae]
MLIEVFKYVLIALFAIVMICSALNSIRSRRTPDPHLAGLYRSWTNIWMGCMLMLLALILMFVYTGSTLSVIVEALFLVMGAYNVFAGLRNRSYYARLQQRSGDASA